MDVAEFIGDADVLVHAATTDEDISSMFTGGVEDLLEASDLAGKRGDQEAAWGVSNDFIEFFADGFFGHGVSWFKSVCRFGEHDSDVLFGELFKFVDFGVLDVAGWGVIEFEIGGVKDFAFGCFDQNGHTIGD